MQLPMPNSKAAQMGLGVVFVVLIALVVIFGPLGKKLGSLLPSGPKAPATLQVPAKSGGQVQAPKIPSGSQTSIQPASHQKSQPTPQAALPQLPVAGNLEELTKLQAQIEEGLLRKKLAELPRKDVSPPVTAGTANQDAKNEQPKAAEPVLPVFEPKPTVVSVQGVEGEMTVTLRDRGALATFQIGERCSAGTITRITRDAVILQGGNGAEPLFFE